MSQDTFETISAGITLENELTHEELAPRTMFPHIDPDSYLWEVAACLRKDMFSVAGEPTGFADLFDSKHADKDRDLTERRWNTFQAMYHRIEKRLEDDTPLFSSPDARGNRYQEAVAASLVDCLLDIQADAGLMPHQIEDLEQLSHELAAFYFTEPHQNFHELLD